MTDVEQLERELKACEMTVGVLAKSADDLARNQSRLIAACEKALAAMETTASCEAEAAFIREALAFARK